jgi:hypothetical protein
VKFYRDCIVRFIDREEGAKFLAVEDDFLSGMSRFDLQSRLKTTKEVTKADYLAMTTRMTATSTRQRSSTAARSSRGSLAPQARSSARRLVSEAPAARRRHHHRRMLGR